MRESKGFSGWSDHFVIYHWNIIEGADERQNPRPHPLAYMHRGAPFLLPPPLSVVGFRGVSDVLPRGYDLYFRGNPAKQFAHRDVNTHSADDVDRPTPEAMDCHSIFTVGVFVVGPK